MQHETDLSGRPEGLSLRSLASLSPSLSLSLLPSLPLSLSSLCASPFCVCLSSRAAASPDPDFCAALLAAAASLAADSFFARSRFSRSCSGGTIPQTRCWFCCTYVQTFCLHATKSQHRRLLARVCIHSALYSNDLLAKTHTAVGPLKGFTAF